MTCSCRSCHSRHRSCHRPSCSPAAPADRSGWWRSARRQRSSLHCRLCHTGRCGGRPGRWSRTRCGTSSSFRRSRYPAAGSRFRCGQTGTAPCCRTGRCGSRRNCRNRTGCAGGRRPAGSCRKADSLGVGGNETAGASGFPEAGGITAAAAAEGKAQGTHTGGSAAHAGNGTLHKITPLKGHAKCRCYSLKEKRTRKKVFQFNYNTKQPRIPLQENAADGYRFMTDVQDAVLLFRRRPSGPAAAEMPSGRAGTPGR